MKKLTIKANTNVAKNTKVMSAVNHFVKTLNAATTEEMVSHFRYFVRSEVKSNQYGELTALDITGEINVSFDIYEAAGDLFIVPDFALEGGWNGVSVNGQGYDVQMVLKGMDWAPMIVVNA